MSEKCVSDIKPTILTNSARLIHMICTVILVRDD